ncbi:MAG: hypothetical protein WD075_02035 [Rhodospirillales bacterium]
MSEANEKRKWGNAAERGSPILIRFIVWLAMKVGRGPTRLLLHPICVYFVLLAPATRRNSAAYLARVLARRPTTGDVYRHIHTFAATLLDRVFFMSDRFELFDIQLEGVEQLEAARARGKGVILLGAHVGSFDAMRALAETQVDARLKVLMHTGVDGRVARVIDGINPAIARSIIPLGDPSSMLQVYEWLQHGGMVGILADRIAHGDKTHRLDFLGGHADFPAGAWLLAHLTGAPVVMFSGLYWGGNRYVVRFHTLSNGERFARGQRDDAIVPHMQAYATTLEGWVREAPNNWFNFYDFWA